MKPKTNKIVEKKIKSLIEILNIQIKEKQMIINIYQEDIAHYKKQIKELSE